LDRHARDLLSDALGLSTVRASQTHRSRTALAHIGQGASGRCPQQPTNEYVSRTVPRLRTIALVALIVVLTDVTWDGKSLRISIGLPGRRRLAQLVFP
jgi:hypothetical protein